MKVFETLKAFKEYRQVLSHSYLSDEIGLVPTMGNLHQGHLNLVEYSLYENETTIVTIFVNPKQFGPNEDYEKYPRTKNEDIKKLEKLLSDPDLKDKNLIVFAPKNPCEIYGENFSMSIIENSLSNKLCGLSRPGHFEGVTTVVYKLFSTSRPHNAYFGKKDYQQYLIIKKMAENLDLPIKVVGLPITRESDGLALSSRNVFLNATQRNQSLNLYKTLNQVKEKIERDGKISDLEIDNIKIKSDYYEWDYLEVLDIKDLEAINKKTKEVLIAGSIKFDCARLIDNITVKINV